MELDIVYKIRQLASFLKDIPDKVRHFYQRGKRGWSDDDWWNMDCYLTDIIMPMLKELKEKHHGYPVDSSGKWDAILDQMIRGFEAGKRVIDDEYYMDTNADILTREPTTEEIKLWIAKAKADQKIFNEGMKLFTKFFFHLWD